MHPAIRRLLVAASLLLLPAAARADVAPPADYVDPCESAELDESCRRCISPEFKDRRCHERARAAGQTVRCQAWSYAMYCGGESGPSVEALAQADPAETATDKTATDKTAADKTAADKTVTDKTATDKTAADKNAAVAEPPATAEAPSAAQESAPKAAQSGRCALAGDRPAPVAALALLLILARRRRRAAERHRPRPDADERRGSPRATKRR